MRRQQLVVIVMQAVWLALINFLWDGNKQDSQI